MELSEATINSFIIRVWVEETAEGVEQVTWRGHITHIPSNERRYIQNLDEITNFITLYLEVMGVEFGNAGE